MIPNLSKTENLARYNRSFKDLNSLLVYAHIKSTQRKISWPALDKYIALAFSWHFLVQNINGKICWNKLKKVDIDEEELKIAYLNVNDI